MLSVSAKTLTALVCALAMAASHAESPSSVTPKAQSEVINHPDLGRVRWTFPEGFDYVLGGPVRDIDNPVPGPRILCRKGSGEECEIVVFIWDPSKPVSERAEELKAGLLSEMLDAVEHTVDVKTYGKSDPVFYATLTDKHPNTDFRYLTRGVYAKPPLVIWFTHLSNDSTQMQLTRILELVHSAEPLDARPIIASKLAYYIAGCSARFPANAGRYRAAYAASAFSTADVLKFYREQPRASGDGRDIEAALAEETASFVKEMQKIPSNVAANVCESVPQWIRDADNSLRK
jgi:hypothetical protein